LLGIVPDGRIAYLTDGVPKDGALRPITFRHDAVAYRAARQCGGTRDAVRESTCAKPRLTAPESSL
jgi:hypothetical protein